MLLYICNFAVINNLYAVFFAEVDSHFAESVIEGSYAFYALKPRSLFKNYVYLHLNMPALAATPFLLAINLYFIKRCGLEITFKYLLSVICSTVNMGLIFMIVASLTLFGLRSQALSSVVTQMLSVAEKPDTVFPKVVQRILLYIVPVFLFSAFPMHVLLSSAGMAELIWGLSSPIFYTAILSIVLKAGKGKYQPADE